MVSRYRAIAKLGFGGMAEVRLALAQRAGGFNKLLVLKLLREELAADPEFLEMFLAEARVAALLNHPNIVQTNEVGAENNRYFMAMEYLDGQPLSALITRLTRKNVPLDLHVYVLAQILHGLHYAHELTDLEGKPLSLIHRDVSPQNVFVTYSGQVKLLDFGIAKVAGAGGMTRTGILKGKVGYMAPEQARMDVQLDRRADIFAVGVMLWEALAKQRFVESKADEVMVLQRRITNDERKLADVAPDADPILTEICNKAMAFDRADRWADAQTFAEALEGWLKKTKTALEKEIGTLLSDSFREERSRIRQIVEEASAKPAVDGTTTSPDLRDLLASMDVSAGSTGPSQKRDVASEATQPRPAPKSRLPLVLGLAAVATVGVIGFVRLRKPDVGPDKQVGTTVAASASTPGPSSTVAVRIRTTPVGAKLVIDNGPPLATPYEGSLHRDQATHSLRVTMDGYTDEERSVSANNDIDLDIALRKATPVADAAAPTAKPAVPTWVGNRVQRPTNPTVAPVETTNQVKPPPPKKSKHSIDEVDPYSNP